MSIRNSKPRRIVFVCLALAFLALAPSRARAQSLFITSAVADPVSGVLTIKGFDLCRRDARVSVHHADRADGVEPDSRSDHDRVAVECAGGHVPPSAVPPGVGAIRMFDFTWGTAGPPGPQGATGARQRATRGAPWAGRTYPDRRDRKAYKDRRGSRDLRGRRADRLFRRRCSRAGSSCRVSREAT